MMLQTKPSPTLTCKGCGVEVQVVDGKIVRPCDCPEDTGATAHLSATVYGVGSMEKPE